MAAALIHVQRRRCQAISAIDKQRIVNAFEDPERDYLEMANTLGIPRGTAWSIVHRYQLAGGEVIVRRRGGGRPIKIDQEMQQCLVRLVEQHPNFTLDQLNVEMRHELPDKPVVCGSMVHRLLKGQLITLKKMDPAERNRDDVKHARRIHCEWLLQGQEGDLAELLYTDEAGFNLWMARTRGRAPQGQRAVRIVGGRRGPNFTIILAVSNITEVFFIII